MIVVLSPHLDDAVLSLGQFIAAATEPIHVVTVFAGSPPEGLTAYDEARGFTSSRQAMGARRVEDRNACQTLEAETVHLEFLDAQYGDPADDESMAAKLRPFYRPDWDVFVPLGIGHPDHVQVARCARAAMTTGTLICYEELPYRVDHPEQVVDALDKIRAEGWQIADLPYPLDQGPRATKVAALECYKSQLDPSEPSFLVGERAWRIAR